MSLAAHTMNYKSFVPDVSNHRLLRNALGCFGTGVTIVTTACDEGAAAITVNSFASVSLTPPLVLWSLDRHCSRFQTFSNAEHYSIHVLATHQQDLCMDIARNPTHLHEQELARNHLDVPILDECMVRLDCSREAVYDAGDHVIILGRVQLTTQHADESGTLEPLAFYRGNTGTFVPTSRNAS